MFLGTMGEIAGIVTSIVGLIHCYSTRGKWDTIKIYVIGFLYGMILENGGPAVIPALGLTGYFWFWNGNVVRVTGLGETRS